MYIGAKIQRVAWTGRYTYFWANDHDYNTKINLKVYNPELLMCLKDQWHNYRRCRDCICSPGFVADGAQWLATTYEDTSIINRPWYRFFLRAPESQLFSRNGGIGCRSKDDFCSVIVAHMAAKEPHNFSLHWSYELLSMAILQIWYMYSIHIQYMLYTVVVMDVFYHSLAYKITL